MCRKVQGHFPPLGVCVKPHVLLWSHRWEVTCVSSPPSATAQERSRFSLVGTSNMWGLPGGKDGGNAEQESDRRIFVPWLPGESFVFPNVRSCSWPNKDLKPRTRDGCRTVEDYLLDQVMMMMIIMMMMWEERMNEKLHNSYRGQAQHSQCIAQEQLRLPTKRQLSL